MRTKNHKNNNYKHRNRCTDNYSHINRSINRHARGSIQFKNRKLYCYDVCVCTDEGTKQLFVFTMSIAKVPAQSHGLRTTEDGGHEGDLHLYFDILTASRGIGIAATTSSCASRSAPDTTSSTSAAEEGLEYVSCTRIDIVAIEG